MAQKQLNDPPPVLEAGADGQQVLIRKARDVLEEIAEKVRSRIVITQSNKLRPDVRSGEKQLQSWLLHQSR